MAKCECGLEMLSPKGEKGCDLSHVIIQRAKYDEDLRDPAEIRADPTWIGPKITGHEKRSKNYKRFKYTKEQASHSGNPNCHDCNVKIGGTHHVGCDMEYCPAEGWPTQIFMCDCKKTYVAMLAL